MTLPSTSAPSNAVRSASAWSSGVQRLTAVGAAALVTACANVQLPPWPGNGAQQPQPAQAAARPAAQQPVADATAQPVAPASQLTPLPYNPAIEARFPDPTVRYDTPGLTRPDLPRQRRQFTTQAEMSSWLQSLAAKSQGSGTTLGLLNIGSSQRGTPIQALVATRAASIQASSLNSSGRPTALLVAQQHGDEPAGAEALLIIARELAPGGLLAPLLQQINVVIVPRANPDGAETASHLTADGADLAHDHLLLNTPEARALATLVRDYRPAAVIDLHEYAAAGQFLQKYQAVQSYDALLQYASTANAHEFVTKAAREWYVQPVRSALSQAGLSNEWFYKTSAEPNDKSVSMATLAPDTLSNTSSLKNAAALFISSRGSDLGAMHIQRRVHTLVTAITSALRATAEKARNLNQVEEFVARDVSSLACRQQFTVKAQQTPEQRSITMLQASTGAEQQARLDWNSSLQIKASQTRPRPCGYLISADSRQAVQRLRQLGLQVQQIAEPGPVLVDSYQEPHNTGGSSALVLTRSSFDAPAGSYYLSLNQPKAQLAAAALEPDTPYSYVSQGLITSISDIARVVATPSVVFDEDADE